MAKRIRCLSQPILNAIHSTANRFFTFKGTRSLYTEHALDLIDYKNSREQLKKTPGLDAEGFRQVLKISLRNEKNPVTGGDLKKMLHLIEKNEDDLSLLKTMLDRFHDQGQDDKTYIFGPIVMRAFHHLNEPQKALEGMRNPKFQGLFDQPKTCAILVDLLYENGMYNEVRSVYDCLRHKSVSTLVLTVVFMTCYKENTPESLQYALKIWKESCSQGRNLLRRMIVTLAALALNQNECELALDVIQHCRKVHVFTVRSIKIMALCDLNKLDEILAELRYASHASHYLADVAHKFDALVKRLDVQPDSEIHTLFESLKDQNCIQALTLGEYISTPIDVPKRPKDPSTARNAQLDRRKFQNRQPDWGYGQ